MTENIVCEACSNTCTRVTFQTKQYLKFEIQEQACFLCNVHSADLYNKADQFSLVTGVHPTAEHVFCVERWYSTVQK